MSEECGSTIGIRYSDAPADQWESATCIRTHETSPGAERTIHDSGDGWKWTLLDGFEEQAPLIVPSAELKMLRETLTMAQIGMGFMLQDPDDMAETDRLILHRERLERLIAEIDRQRPLGLDGEHGELHTPTCGCEDRS